MNSSITNAFKIPSKVPLQAFSKVMEQKPTLLETEISVIYSEYKKNQKLMNAPQQLKITHDQDKWRKKFFLVFNREKTLDLSNNPALPLDMKNLSPNLSCVNKQGEKIMKTNSKFWVIYIKLVSEKLNEERKEFFKETISKNFKDNKTEYQILYKEIGEILNLDVPELDTKENELPRFGGSYTPGDEKPEQPFQDQTNMGHHNQQLLQTADQTQVIPNSAQPIINETFCKQVIPNQTMTDISCLNIQEELPKQYEENNFLIPAPSQEYLVRAPIQMSQVSIISTPNFQEYKNQEQGNEGNDTIQEEQEMRDEGAENVVQNLEKKMTIEALVEHPNVTFHIQQNLEKQTSNSSEETDKQEDIAMSNESIEQEDDNEKLFNQEDYEDLKRDDEQEFQEQREEFDIQLDIENQEEENNEDIREEEQFELQEDKNDCQEDVINESEKVLEITQNNEPQIQSQQQPLVSSLFIEEEKDEDNSQLPQEESYNASTRKNVNTKKRRRSVSNTSMSSMTLRSKYKKRRLNNEGENTQIGASYVRYEIIDKKGQQQLVPVRYSIRRQSEIIIGQQDLQLERKILNNEIDFEYKPSEIEGLFGMDQTTQDIQKILKSRFIELQKCDIQEVVSVNNENDFSLIKIKPEAREKYGGHLQVAAALKRLSVSPHKSEKQMRQMMQQLLKEKQVREIMFTNASDEAIDFIRKK